MVRRIHVPLVKADIEGILYTYIASTHTLLIEYMYTCMLQYFIHGPPKKNVIE